MKSHPSGWKEVPPSPDDIPKIPMELLYPDDVIEDEVEDNDPDHGRYDW